LDDPIAIFRERQFPNGHYRIYLEEIRTRRIRLILDVHIYNGRVVPPNFRQGGGEKRESGPEAMEAATLGESLDRRDPGGEGQVDPLAGPPFIPPRESAPPGGASNPAAGESQAETGDRSPIPLAGAAGAVMLGTPEWRERLRRAFQAGARPLSRAARRLRRARLDQAAADGRTGGTTRDSTLPDHPRFNSGESSRRV
jgi:hypothetical protein